MVLIQEYAGTDLSRLSYFLIREPWTQKAQRVVAGNLATWVMWSKEMEERYALQDWGIHQCGFRAAVKHDVTQNGLIGNDIVVALDFGRCGYA